MRGGSRRAVTQHRPAGAELGRRFSDVRVLRTGSRFTLYVAHDPATYRRVVIKVRDAASPRWLHDLLEHEGAVLAAAGAHPNVVTLYERYLLPGNHAALVLEHCARSIADVHHDDGRMAPDAVAHLGIALAGALETLHGQGVVHCDVRPHNVLMNDWGEPLLSGFDESVYMHPLRTDRPALWSTTQYTAPELIQGDDPTVSADVYSLAATLYELLAGRRAFRAYAGESSAAVIVRMLGARVPPVATPGVPNEMSDLLLWALATDPRDRPPTPAWLGEELARIAGEHGWARTRMVAG